VNPSVPPALNGRGIPARAIRSTLAAALVVGVLLAGQPAAAKPGRIEPKTTKPQPVPSVIGFPAVDDPTIPVPAPLPTMGGSVKVDTAESTGSAAGDSDTMRAEAPSAEGLSAEALNAEALSAEALSAEALALAGPARIALRALVITPDAADFGTPTWRAMLDRVGAAYDVLDASTTPLTSDVLVRPDGAGRYNAILLTNSMLLFADAGGTFVSGFTADEWNALWAYERDYGVRQATLYTSYGTWPEDYCLRGRTEGTVGDTALPAALTANGAALLDYLKPSAQVPIVQSYVYRNTLEAGCDARAVLTNGTDVLGVETTSVDGRQRMALSFTSNQHLLQAHLLTYGLFRWASRGLFLGEKRQYLNTDVDDWFNTSDVLQPDGTINSDPGYEMSGHDAYNAYLRQTALRTRYPLASGFTMGMAFNAGDANTGVRSQCWPTGGVNRLSATTKCLRNDFRWINHTLTHPEMNFTDYATSVREIDQNLVLAQRMGLPVDRTVLKTGEYSGLGVYNPNPDDDVNPPTDFGLGASNPNLLQAAKDLGVKYLHGNMSFPSHQPSCFNCGIYHPLEPSLFIVPDWPTNIAYFATTAAQETQFYNSFYGPNGRFPFFPTNLTYAQLMNYETDQALSRVATGSVYTNTFHIGNLRDYSGGRTLLTDWADLVIGKYSSYYSVPLLTPTWPALAAYAAGRNAHFAQLGAGVDAVYDSGSNTVTVSSPLAGSLTVNGVQTAGSSTYGSDVSASVALAANVPVTVTGRLLP